MHFCCKETEKCNLCSTVQASRKRTFAEVVLVHVGVWYIRSSDNRDKNNIIISITWRHTYLHAAAHELVYFLPSSPQTVTGETPEQSQQGHFPSQDFVVELQTTIQHHIRFA
jgi:hypothetical protein